MADDQSTNVSQQEPESYLAALDIGSNSFHFVLARQVDQHLQILHSEKYRVQLAQGLDEQDQLSAEAINRGVTVLEKLATSTSHITQHNFKAVGTYTLRQAKNSADFLNAAKAAFPFNIEIISGHEEARLIYQGVAHHRQYNDQQLVIDIGGGSTECIIGQRYQTKQLDSLNIGCVSYQQAFFSEGKISKKAFKQAIKSASHQVDTITRRFKKCGWQQVIGTSGTIKAISNIINYDNELPKPITIKALISLKEQLLAFSSVEHIELDGLKENRRSVICSGVAILIALMQCLEIDSIEYCQYALREGVLFEQLENLKRNNVKKRSIDSLTNRFNIDVTHANAVKSLALTMHQQLASNWQLDDRQYEDLLSFAAQLHELGIDINTSGYQKHGRYIIEQADIAGFNQEQQNALAWLVGNQRKKITQINPQSCYLLDSEKLNKLCVILRLSVLLNQQRHHEEEHNVKVATDGNTLTLRLNHQWLAERPIIDTELFYEQEVLKNFGVNLVIES